MMPAASTLSRFAASRIEYLPTSGKYFGSRQGYGLTYASCQESRKSPGLYRPRAAEMGTDEKTINLASQGQGRMTKETWSNPGTVRRGISSSPRRCDGRLAVQSCQKFLKRVGASSV